MDDKKVLLSNQFAWVASKKDGKMKLIVGPDPFSDVTEEDIFMMPSLDGDGSFRIVESATAAIQNFITIHADEYAVIYNPADGATVENPNAGFQSSRNDLRGLQHGKKRIVVAGHFPVWPGQIVEIRKIHNLSASQYIIVQVESLEIDKEAPYYELTRECAKIKKAVTEIRESVPTVAQVSKEVEENAEESQEQDLEKDPEKEESIVDPPETSEKNDDKESDKSIDTFTTKGSSGDSPRFEVGQRIIIPGNKTPNYIPPSGIEIVVETAMITDSEFESENETDLKKMIARSFRSGSLTSDNWQNFLISQDIPEDYLDEISDTYSRSVSTFGSEKALIGSISHLPTRYRQSIVAALQNKVSYDRLKNRDKKSDKIIHQAVVLGPTEFCILIDEDGNSQTKVGPGRIFPGPNDQFSLEGSNSGVYKSYHIRKDRGLLLRVIGESVKAIDLNLPVEVEKKEYSKGDEIFVGGVDAYVVPTHLIEIINPLTREPHIGNDHTDIYVNSIGIDQKSGIYVADVETGNVKLVKGEKKVLLDPRKDKHIQRIVSAKLWNLMIGKGEPHKMVTNERSVVTPWALSIVIPNNEAILIVGKDGRRAVRGPCTELLEFEEILEVLSISRGRPKTDQSPLSTCFLRVTGNRPSDRIILETKDFVEIEIDVCYDVEFLEDEGSMDRCFNYKDYIMLFVANTRSRLRACARQLTFTEIQGNLAEFVRDTILGVKPEEGHRKGLLFEENGLRIAEVEVLSSKILNQEIAKSIWDSQTTLVKNEIEDVLRQANLLSSQKQAEADEALTMLKMEAIQRDKDLSLTQTDAESEVMTEKVQRDRAIDEIKLKATHEKTVIEENTKDVEVSREILRNFDVCESEISSDKLRNDEELRIKTEMVNLEKDLNKSAAESTKIVLNSVQAGFIEAIEGLGNKQVLEAFAKNLPEASGSLGFLLGKGGTEGLMKMLGDFPKLQSVAKQLLDGDSSDIIDAEREKSNNEE